MTENIKVTNLPLNASFSLNGPGYIEASAGTGKTFTITCLISRLILGSKNFEPVPLEKILVMTFTKSAARDIKRKIRERLLEVNALFQDDREEPNWASTDPDNLLCYLYDFVKIFHDPNEKLSQNDEKCLNRNQVARLLLRNALENIDKATISTIHSFCTRMLKRHAVLAGMSFNQNLVTGDDEENKNQEAILLAIREIFYSSGLSESDTEKILKKSKIFDSDSWLSNLAKNLNIYASENRINRYPYPEFSSKDSTLKKAFESLKNFNEESREKLEPLFHRINEEYSSLVGKTTCFSESKKDFGNCFLDVKANDENFYQKYYEQFNEFLIKSLNPDKLINENADTIKLSVSNENLKKIEEGSSLLKFFWGKTKKTKGEVLNNLLDQGFAEVIEEINRTMSNVPDLKNIVYDRVLTRAAEFLKTEKNRDGIIYQNDLLSSLETAIRLESSSNNGKQGPLSKAIFNDFPIAIIDEFQDTDPVQFSIVSQVYLDYFENHKELVLKKCHHTAEQPKHSLEGFYVIGDPKQSIYRFRGADVSCYKSAIKKISEFWKNTDEAENHKGNLKVNYRSNSVLVDQVNNLFSVISETECTDINEIKIEDPKFYLSCYKKSDIKYDPVGTPSRSKEKFLKINNQIVSPLTICFENLEDRKPEKKEVSVYKVREVISESCVRKIIEVLNKGKLVDVRDNFTKVLTPERDVKLSDIVILVPSKKMAALIKKTLGKYGIPSVFTSNHNTILDTIEFESIYNLMQAFLHPRDEKVLRFLITSSFFNKTATDISGFFDAEFDEVSQTLIEGLDLWKKHGFISAYSYFVSKLGILDELSKIIGGETVITLLNQAAELAQSLSAHTNNFDGIVSLYKHLMDDAKTGDNELLDDSDYALRSGGNEKLIRITTYHSSKGLEYNLVFMPYAGLWSSNWNNKPPFEPTLYLKDYSPNEPGGLCYDVTDSQACKDNGITEDIAEQLRLWYVAATRAKYGMFLWEGFSPNLIVSSNVRLYTPLYIQLKLFLQNNQVPGESDLKKLEEIIDNKLDNRYLSALAAATNTQIPVVQESKIPLEEKSEEKPVWDKKQLADDDNKEISVKEFKGDISNNWKILSYSSLAGAKSHHGAHEKDPNQENLGDTNDEPTEHDYPDSIDGDSARIRISGGVNTGTFIHSVMEHLSFEKISEDRKNFNKLKDNKEFTLENLLEQVSCARGISDCLDSYAESYQWSNVDGISKLTEWILEVTETPLRSDDNYFTLSGLSDNETVRELNFDISLSQIRDMHDLVEIVRPEDKDNKIISSMEVQGLLNGSVDLFLKHGKKYYVVDYKTNTVCKDHKEYTNEKLEKLIKDSNYDFQYYIYVTAMHRFLKSRLGNNYNYDEHFGGVLYLFVRGMLGKPKNAPESNVNGVYYKKLPFETIKKIDNLFSGNKAQSDEDKKAGEQ